MGVVGVFQRGGGGERIIPTRLPCCISRYFFSWIIVVHNLKKKKEREKNLSRRFGFRGYPWKPSLPPRYTPESHPLLLTGGFDNFQRLLPPMVLIQVKA